MANLKVKSVNAYIKKEGEKQREFVVVKLDNGEGNDINPLHYTGSAAPCTTWGPKPGSGLSPFEPEEWDKKIGDLLIIPNK